MDDFVTGLDDALYDSDVLLKSDGSLAESISMIMQENKKKIEDFMNLESAHESEMESSMLDEDDSQSVNQSMNTSQFNGSQPRACDPITSERSPVPQFYLENDDLYPANGSGDGSLTSSSIKSDDPSVVQMSLASNNGTQELSFEASKYASPSIVEDRDSFKIASSSDNESVNLSDLGSKDGTLQSPLQNMLKLDLQKHIPKVEESPRNNTPQYKSRGKHMSQPDASSNGKKASQKSSRSNGKRSENSEKYARMNKLIKQGEEFEYIKQKEAPTDDADPKIPLEIDHNHSVNGSVSIHKNSRYEISLSISDIHDSSHYQSDSDTSSVMVQKSDRQLKLEAEMEALMANWEGIISEIRENESPQKPAVPLEKHSKSGSTARKSSQGLSGRDTVVMEDIAPVVEISSFNASSNLPESNDVSVPDMRHGRIISMDSEIEIVTPRRRHVSMISSPSEDEEPPKRELRTPPRPINSSYNDSEDRPQTVNSAVTAVQQTEDTIVEVVPPTPPEIDRVRHSDEVYEFPKMISDRKFDSSTFRNQFEDSLIEKCQTEMNTARVNVFNDSSVSFQAEDLFLEHGKLSPVSMKPLPAISSKLAARIVEDDIEPPPRLTVSPVAKVLDKSHDNSHSILSISQEEISQDLSHVSRKNMNLREDLGSDAKTIFVTTEAHQEQRPEIVKAGKMRSGFIAKCFSCFKKPQKSV